MGFGCLLVLKEKKNETVKKKKVCKDNVACPTIVKFVHFVIFFVAFLFLLLNIFMSICCVKANEPNGLSLLLVMTCE